MKSLLDKSSVCPLYIRQPQNFFINMPKHPKESILSADSVLPLCETPRPYKVYGAEYVEQGALDQNVWRQEIARAGLTLTNLGVEAMVNTADNVHDGQCMASCLTQVELPSGSLILADKGYCSAKNNQLLRQRGLRSRYPTQGLQA